MDMNDKHSPNDNIYENDQDLTDLVIRLLVEVAALRLVYKRMQERLDRLEKRES